MAPKSWFLMIAVVVALCMAVPTVVTGVVAAPEKGKRCFDGIDNDDDGLIDEADPDCGGDDGGDGGGGGATIDNIFSLEIRDTDNLMGDNPDFEFKSLYVDQRLSDLRADAGEDADECVTGNQQNTRGNDKRYGAFLDLDRGSANSGDPDFANCNEFHDLGTDPLEPPFRRTVTMVIPDPDKCACDVLGAGADWDAEIESCTVTPDVVGMVGQPDDANPRVTATQVVGNRTDVSFLRIMWQGSDGANYTIVSASEIPFTRELTTWDDEPVERIRFLSKDDAIYDFEFGDPDSTCSGTFEFEVDVTYLHQQCVLDADGKCAEIQ